MNKKLNKCGHCGKSYKNIKKLLKHIRRKHNSDIINSEFYIKLKEVDG